MVYVVERLGRVARRGEARDRIWHALVCEDVYPLVDDRDDRRRRAGRGKCDADFRPGLGRAEQGLAALDGNRHLLLGGTHRDRRQPVRAHREVLRVRLHALHDRDEDVEVRRVLRRDRTQHDLARRVREREDVGVRVLLAQHRDERPAGERRADAEARRLAYAVERLVRDERDCRRIGHRRAHRLVRPVAEVERHAERRERLGVRQLERIVAAGIGRELDSRLVVR